MKGSTGWMALAAALAVLVLQSPPALATNTQQDKMTTCNADASRKGLTGPLYVFTTWDGFAPRSFSTNATG